MKIELKTRPENTVLASNDSPLEYYTLREILEEPDKFNRKFLEGCHSVLHGMDLDSLEDMETFAGLCWQLGKDIRNVETLRYISEQLCVVIAFTVYRYGRAEAVHHLKDVYYGAMECCTASWDKELIKILMDRSGVSEEEIPYFDVFMQCVDTEAVSGRCLRTITGQTITVDRSLSFV